MKRLLSLIENWEGVKDEDKKRGELREKRGKGYRKRERGSATFLISESKQPKMSQNRRRILNNTHNINLPSACVCVEHNFEDFLINCTCVCVWFIALSGHVLCVCVCASCDDVAPRHPSLRSRTESLIAPATLHCLCLFLCVCEWLRDMVFVWVFARGDAVPTAMRTHLCPCMGYCLCACSCVCVSEQQLIHRLLPASMNVCVYICTLRTNMGSVVCRLAC